MKPAGIIAAEGLRLTPTVPDRVCVAGLRLAAGGGAGTTVRVIAPL